MDPDEHAALADYFALMNEAHATDVPPPQIMQDHAGPDPTHADTLQTEAQARLEEEQILHPHEEADIFQAYTYSPTPPDPVEDAPSAGEVEMGQLDTPSEKSPSLCSDDAWGPARHPHPYHTYMPSSRPQSRGLTALANPPRVKSCCLVTMVVVMLTTVVTLTVLAFEEKPAGTRLWDDVQADTLSQAPGLRWVVRVPSAQVVVVTISPAMYPGVTALEGWTPDRQRVLYRALVNHSDWTTWVHYTGGELNGNCYRLTPRPQFAPMEWVDWPTLLLREEDGYQLLQPPVPVEPFAWQIDRRVVSYDCQISSYSRLARLQLETVPRNRTYPAFLAPLDLDGAHRQMQKEHRFAYGVDLHEPSQTVQSFLTSHAYSLKTGGFVPLTTNESRWLQGGVLPFNAVPCQGLTDTPVLLELCLAVVRCFQRDIGYNLLSTRQPQCRDSTYQLQCECTQGLARSLIQAAYNQCGRCNDTVTTDACVCWAKSLLLSQAVSTLPCSNLTDRLEPLVAPTVFFSPTRLCSGSLREQCVHFLHAGVVAVPELTLRCQSGNEMWYQTE